MNATQTTQAEFVRDARAAGYALGVAKNMVSVYDSVESGHEVARVSWRNNGLDFAGLREGDTFRRVISLYHVRDALGLPHSTYRTRPTGGSLADSSAWPWHHNHVPADA